MIFAHKWKCLEQRLAGMDALLVALSGGVDSAALLGAARLAMRGRLLAVTTSSAAVAPEEVESAARAAALLGVEHRVLETRELQDERYLRNAGRRCYFCRTEMYGRLGALARKEGIPLLADGVHAGDGIADRPGLQAAAEMSVLHPLRAAGFEKADVRRLARAFGLPHHDRPAEPCLASRLPVGIRVTAERLARVERAERAVRGLGFRVVRVRCEDQHGRVEIGAGELRVARARERELVEAVLDAGFTSAALDEAGYRTGGAG